MDWASNTASIGAFLAVTALVAAGVLWFSGRDARVSRRLGDLADSPGVIVRRRRGKGTPPHGSRGIKTLLAGLGGRFRATPREDGDQLHARLFQAGIYSPSAPSIYTAARIIAGCSPLAVGILLGVFDLFDFQQVLLWSFGGALAGLLAPEWWLRWKRARRQARLRTALPDFLDLTVACLEAGQSFEGALQRVTDEMRTAHPVLATELAIVQREIDWGTTPAQSLRNFGERSGLDVVRTLSNFVDQARRLGSSIAEALHTLADMLRTQREQRAEELAQKAAVKILFPTLLFIFPPILVVLAGPAAIEIQKSFSQQSAESRPAAMWE